MKKIKFIALFLCSLFLLITFTACDDSYKPKYYEHQEIPSVFNENKDINTTTSGRGLRIVKHLVDELEINNNEISAKIKCETDDV